MIGQLRRLGLARCVMQADGEPAQRTFIKDIIEEAGRVGSTGVAQAHPPAYDHRSNGDVERAIRELKNQVRVLHGALVRNVGAIPSIIGPSLRLAGRLDGQASSSVERWSGATG